MRSYEDFVAASNDEDTRNNIAIPYHAREDSLPFSYGHIGKTSTPLRNVGTSGYRSDSGGLYSRGNGVNKYNDFDDYIFNSKKDENFYLNYERKYENGYKSNDKITTSKFTDNATDGIDDRFNGLNGSSNVNGNCSSGSGGGMIKTQPRLTSPLLVRKTLSSRSPTRNASTNTIANTYTYQYDPGHRSDGRNGLSENISYTNNYNKFNYNHTNSGYKYNINTKGNSIYGNNMLRKTPPRKDLDEQLRECREKVYGPAHEFRATSPTIPVPASYRNKPPQPPQRSNFTNGGSIGHRSHQNYQSYYQKSSQQRLQEQPVNSKYNYDIEFNLNLDDLPRRPNTIERTSSLQYRTRDIPVVRDTSYGEHRNNASGYGDGGHDELDRISRIYESRDVHSMNTISDTNRSATNYNSHNYIKSSNYGANNNNNSINNNNSSNEFLTPIYATTTKKQVTSTSGTSYRQPERLYQGSQDLLLTPSSTLSGRPETPGFPVTPRTPLGQNRTRSQSPQLRHSEREYPQSEPLDLEKHNSETIYRTTYRSRLGSAMSNGNSEPQEVAAHLVKFAKDSSKFWYKPNLSREEAISILLNAEPGTFVIRNSTTYKDAYGLVLRVAHPPPGSSGKPDELVRHFLIEPTTRGVRLKSSANEPVFTSLSAFVYEHSVNQIALPCLLRIPERDIMRPLVEPTTAQKQLATQGAATNVLWLHSCGTESLTGEEAIRKAVRELFEVKNRLPPTVVHFKVTQHGITLTDNSRKMFFRKHYTADDVSFCSIDPDHRTWIAKEKDLESIPQNIGDGKKTIFAFVAKCSPTSKDNNCHVFCELSMAQPASAIVSFVNKILPTEKQRNYVL